MKIELFMIAKNIQSTPLFDGARLCPGSHLSRDGEEDAIMGAHLTVHLF